MRIRGMGEEGRGRIESKDTDIGIAIVLSAS